MIRAVPTDPSSPGPVLIGTRVGNYKITRKLSRGGMGTVYGAEHALIGRLAAIKILHPEYSGNKDIVNRFFNEAKATTSIQHSGIVEIFDYGFLPSGDGYIVMEFLDGMSLARRLKRGGRFNEGEAAMLVRGVCVALAAAHNKNIVHRDLKPDNLFLVADPESQLGERAKILDFGIAKLTDVGLAGTATKTGAVMGTPTYMSPEQCRGTGDVDHRADLYSLGCILYELMCGRPPFCNLGAGELIGAHLHIDPDPPSKYEPTISGEMEELILALLDKDPAKRPRTAPELAVRLGRIASAHGFQVNATHPTGLAGSKLMQAQMLPPPGDDPRSIPTEFTPDIEISAQDTSTQTVSDKPTTLSGAAQSQQIVSAPRRRRYGLAAAAVVLAAVAVIVIVIVAGPTNNAASVASPSEPTGGATSASSPRAAPAVAPAAVTPAAGPPALDPPAADPPAVDPRAADTPAADTPAADTPAVDTPAADTHAVASKHRRHDAKPRTHAKSKRPTKPDKPVKPAESPEKIDGPIETDL